MKNPEIKILNDYSKVPPAEFWSTFPNSPIPEEVSTGINVDRLEYHLANKAEVLTEQQRLRGERIVYSLRNGASNLQKSRLPPVMVPNANSTVRAGPAVTDTVATWIKCGFAVGPFDEPPLKNFRVNSLVAIDNGVKVRPILDVSQPLGCSFNSNVQEELMEKVYMSSPRLFGYSVCDAGCNSVISKFDSADAYKNVPCRLYDLRLQGFSWLSKFFIETKQIFGARTAVANYDILGNTVRALVLTNCDIPGKYVHRHLDDIPVVGPENSNWCQQFTSEFRKFSEDINMKLAPDCPMMEKAFSNSKTGKVLGIIFDTRTLSWRLPVEKNAKCIRKVSEVLNAESVTLEQLQELVGLLNFVALMCPFLYGFRAPLTNLLAEAHSAEGNKVKMSEAAIADLRVWGAFFKDEDKVMPIPPRPTFPTLVKKVFYSDAAGGPGGEGKIGAASVGFNEDEEIFFANRVFWPEKWKGGVFDRKGANFESKTATLELVGLMLPLLLIPEKLQNQHIVFKVDNLSCVFGWENKKVKEDEMASVLIRTIHLIEAKLGSRIHVFHVPRCSTWEARCVDRMSRERTTLRGDQKLLSRFSRGVLPSVFKEWLENPKEDWGLPINVLKEL
jgi:hypothetical protein